MEKRNLLHDLEVISNIVHKELQGNKQLENTLVKLKNEIDSFKVKVLVVGGFSAGKSSLLNRLLNTDLLKEAITPQTAIATELHYGEEEQVTLVKPDGQEIKCNFEEAESQDPTAYLKYIYTVNNEKLKELDEYVLVDMPGFDSGVEAHNTAILQYIDQGAAYILVVDAQDGCIKDSAIKFLNEIQLYSEHIGVIITKSDLKINSELESIVSEVKNELNEIIGIMPPLVATSVVDEQVSEKVTNIINSFQPQILLENKFGYLISSVGNEIIDTLKELEVSMDLDTQEIDDKIYEQEVKKANILKNIEVEKKNLHINLINNVKPAILEEVESGLRNNIEQLVSAALAGNENLKREIASIVRPLLLQSVQDNIGYAVEQLTTSLEMYETDSIDTSDYSNGVSSTLNMDTINSAQSTFNAIHTFAQSASALKAGRRFQAIMGPLAIATDFVAPWMELIIFFAPTILNLIAGKQQSPEEQVREKLLESGIPQIINQLRPNIDSSLRDVEKQLISEIEKQYEQEIEAEVSGLKSLKETKQTSLNEMQIRKNEIVTEIDEIERILSNYRC